MKPDGSMSERTAITTEDTPSLAASTPGSFFSSTGRIGRIAYFWTQLLTVGTAVLVGNVAVWLGEKGYFWAFLLAAPIVFLALYMSIVAAIKRFHDLGKSGWWYLTSIIPIVNILVGLYLLFAKGEDQSPASQVHGLDAKNAREVPLTLMLQTKSRVSPRVQLFGALAFGSVAATAMVAYLLSTNSTFSLPSIQNATSRSATGEPKNREEKENQYYEAHREQIKKQVEHLPSQSSASAKLPWEGSTPAPKAKGEFDGLFDAAIPSTGKNDQPWSECSVELTSRFRQNCTSGDPVNCMAKEYRPKISELSSKSIRYGTSYVLLVSRKSKDDTSSLRALFSCEISKAGEVISLTESTR